MTTAIIAGSITVAKFLYKTFQFACEVVIENQTDYLLVHQSYYPAHGTMQVLAELPAVPPRFIFGSTEYIFDEAIALTNNRPEILPPAVVMEWKFIGKDSFYLIVFAYQAGHVGTNAAYYALSKKPIEPETFWKDAKKNVTWFYVGDVKEHCDRGTNTSKKGALEGIGLEGSATDTNTMILKVKVFAVE